MDFALDEEQQAWHDAAARFAAAERTDGRLIGANGASEPGAGSDIFAMSTRAKRLGDGWVLDGGKTWVSCGPVADLFVCYATTDPAMGVMGINAFLVPSATPGFRVVRE